MTAAQVIEALRRRHPTNRGQWAFVTELPCQGRYIDAWAINCWKSQHLLKVAYEVKVSRADFLSELKQPYKRQPALEHSDEFYFAAPKGLIDPAELPPEAGLVEVYPSGQARVKVRAPRRQAQVACDWEWVAMLARKQVAPHKQRRSETEAARQREHARWLEARNREAQQDRRRALDLLADRLADSVQVGSRWRGPDPGWGRRRAEVTVQVSELRRRSYAPHPLVVFEVLDDGGQPVDLRYTPSEEMGEFLLAFTPVNHDG